jgi:PAS domain S-box-containing protein
MAGGSMVFFIILGSVQIMLAYANIIAMPLIAGIFFLGIVAVMAYELSRDILRAMQLNLDLERERAISQAVFDGVPGMIYLYSPEGRLLRWNKRVVEESGYTDEELSRLSAVDWLAGDDVNALHAKWEAAMNREAVRFEANLVLKGGRQVPYLLTGIQVQIDDKPHLVGMGLDISRQRQMERELQLQQREVARMNRIATLGALSASIAHELNQPLSVVMSNAEAGKRYLGMENPDLAELRAIMADIINAGTRAGDVVRGLRALMESGEAKVELVDLNEVIESVTQLVRAESETRRVEIVKILDTALPPTRGERVQFQQVLLNLLMNAMEGLEKMPFSRRISIRTECAENKNIRMTVQDNGPGISATGMVDIFKPFFTNKRNGTGLGLPICKLIMQLHGGSIRARDAVGGGAVFEVEFPVRQL